MRRLWQVTPKETQSEESIVSEEVEIKVQDGRSKKWAKLGEVQGKKVLRSQDQRPEVRSTGKVKTQTATAVRVEYPRVPGLKRQTLVSAGEKELWLVEGEGDLILYYEQLFPDQITPLTWAEAAKMAMQSQFNLASVVLPGSVKEE